MFLRKLPLPLQESPTDSSTMMIEIKRLKRAESLIHMCRFNETKRITGDTSLQEHAGKPESIQKLKQEKARGSASSVGFILGAS